LRLGTARATRAGFGEGTSLRLTIGLGAVTVIPGRAVVPSAAVAACESRANADPPSAHSSSDVELEARSVRLTENDIVPILLKPRPVFVVDEFGLRLAVDVRRTDFGSSWKTGRA
jgi:hypothetical protein